MEFVLTGPHAGKTILLGKYYQFVDGAIDLRGDDRELGLLARFLELNWQAYPKGHPALRGKEVADGQRDLPAESSNGADDRAGQSSGRGSPAGERDSVDRTGAARTQAGDPVDSARLPLRDGPAAFLNTKLRAAVQGLDPTDDACWTVDDRPSLVAVVAAYGAADVTRAAIEAVAPGYRRPAPT